MTRSAKYFLLDVFSKSRFGGNQLAIFPEGHFVKEELMQPIARELQLSETVFIGPPAQENSHFSMRIFTPSIELPTAGHPTIGSSFYMVRNFDYANSQDLMTLLIDQKVGTIKTLVDMENGVPQFTSMFAPLPELKDVFDQRPKLAEMISLQESDLLENDIQTISCGVNYTIIPVKDLSTLKKADLNISLWKKLKEQLGINFIFCFTLEPETEGCHVQGRMFAPEAGIIEDAATGSAMGPLGTYIYKNNLLPKENSILDIVVEQGFEIGRPSFLHVKISGDGKDVSEIKVGGECTIVGQGELFLD